MKVIDLKQWQKKKSKKSARRSSGYNRHTKQFFLRVGATLLIGYVLNLFMPVWASVLLALTIVGYLPQLFYSSNRRYR